MPVEVVGLPIVREEDGLAMSSRNVYLSPEQRHQALALSAAISEAQQLVKAGERNTDRILNAVRAMIEAQPDARIDYLHICHQHTLADQAEVDSDSVLLLAVFVGETRLIDNSVLLT